MPEQRKVVTVLFADVVGSTEYASGNDPEVVRSRMARHFKSITEIATAYGGTVEKFAGDSAMVVFGVPAAHDDDAERAVRTALEIRDSAGDVAVRIGVHTGEAITAATEDRQFMVSGDTVNVAARLQQGADVGEVLVGPLTYQLTRSVIEYVDREPVTAKGKPEAIQVRRAVRTRSSIPHQARGVPGLSAALVGRGRELRLLLDAYARAAEDGTSYLFTVVGAPGIGKSRLVDEALHAQAAAGARILRGRCLPYGRGITYWPLREMLAQDTGITLGDARDIALRKLDRWLGELLAAEAPRPAIRARLSVLLGLESAQAAMSDIPAERVDREIAWSVRQYMAALAQTAPLIVVVDDLQWAEEPVISLVEQLVERLTRVPLLIVCMARPEFLDSHRAWSAGQPNSTTITLDPLNETETVTLVSRLLEIEALPVETRREIVERSAGTPLFCEEFIRMLIDEGAVVREGDTWKATRPMTELRVPEGINAVLTARLDLLPQPERDVLLSASVIGQRFQVSEVASLAGRGVEPELESLRRKGFVAGGDDPEGEYSFRHILIRDAAYASLPKSERARLHDGFRAVLDGETGDSGQIAEIMAHHAERSFALSRELGLERAVVAQRAAHAQRWLFAMAERARTRYDKATMEPTLAGLAPVVEMLGEGEARARLRLLEAQLMVMKGEYSAATTASEEAAALGEEAGALDIVATARLTQAWIANWAGVEGIDELRAAASLAIEACIRAGDVPGEIEARHVGAYVFWGTGQLDQFVAANEELVRRAEEVGDVAHVAAIEARLVPAEFFLGNTEKMQRHRRRAEELAAQHGLRNVALRVDFDRAFQHMNTGELDDAERLGRANASAAADAGAIQAQLSALRFLGYTLVNAGRPTEAAEILDRAIELSVKTSERWNRTELFAIRARAALDAGSVNSAERFTDQALASLRRDDRTATSEAYLQLGLIRTAQSRDQEAEAAFRTAIDAVDSTGFVNIAAPAALHYAVFLAERGRPQEARPLVEKYGAAIRKRRWRLYEPLLDRYEVAVRAGT